MSKKDARTQRRSRRSTELKVVWKGPRRHCTVEQLSPLIDLIVAAVVQEILEEDARHPAT